MEFRKDINGLRAYAVMAVAFYHFGVPFWGGGFAGVDVFLVISGFLMTGIIVSRLESGTFSWGDFYFSRARRILPAALFLCVVLMILGYFWLIPEDYRMLGKHTAATPVFATNFVFKDEDGYFDAPAQDKWLLHTWSLSLEWQFYLLYPLFLGVVHRFCRRGIKAGVWMTAVASFIFCVLKTPQGPHFIFQTPAKDAFAFYLLPTRIWEFLAGGLVYLTGPLQARRSVRRGGQLLGLVLIMAAGLMFDAQSAWPGYAAVLPVLGAVLVLKACDEEGWLTGTAIAQKLGTWSYSIYLWHWPVVLALSYFSKAGWAWIAGGLALSIACGAASFMAIEQPTRRWLTQRSGRGAVPACGGAAALVSILGLFVFLKDGVPGRVSPEVRAIAAATEDRYHANKDCGYRDPHTFKRCYVGGNGKTKFVLWGDSYAAMYGETMAAAAKGSGLVYSFGCPVIFNTAIRTKERAPCKEFNDLVMHDISDLPKEVPIIIANRLSYYVLGFNEGLKRKMGIDYLDPAVAAAAEHNPQDVFRAQLVQSLCTIAKTRRLYVVQPIPEMGRDVPKILARQAMIASVSDMTLPRTTYEARQSLVISALHEARDQCGVQILDPAPYLCDDKLCYGSRDLQPLYFDNNHLTRHATQTLVPMFQKVFK